MPPLARTLQHAIAEFVLKQPRKTAEVGIRTEHGEREVRRTAVPWLRIVPARASNWVAWYACAMSIEDLHLLEDEMLVQVGRKRLDCERCVEGSRSALRGQLPAGGFGPFGWGGGISSQEQNELRKEHSNAFLRSLSE